MPHSPAEALRLRPIEHSDIEGVLRLNRDHVDLLSPLDVQRLERLLGWTDQGSVIEWLGEPAGFVLTFAPGSSYDSPNYRWFTEHYQDRFYYLDRIVIDPAHRRLGLASLVYDTVELTAERHGRLALEVNLEPPNAPSLAFHLRRGFTEVGRIGEPGHVCTLMAKELGQPLT